MPLGTITLVAITVTAIRKMFHVFLFLCQNQYTYPKYLIFQAWIYYTSYGPTATTIDGLATVWLQGKIDENCCGDQSNQWKYATGYRNTGRYYSGKQMNTNCYLWNHSGDYRSQFLQMSFFKFITLFFSGNNKLQ